jgi:hypothetical protein
MTVWMAEENWIVPITAMRLLGREEEEEEGVGKRKLFLMQATR